MAETKDGGPAFPISIPGMGDNGAGGMSLRDWFAGQALVAFIGKTPLRDIDGYFGRAGNDSPVYRRAEEKRRAEISKEAYALADAMLSAREGKGGGA